MSILRRLNIAIILAALVFTVSVRTARAGPGYIWYVDPTGYNGYGCGAYASNPCKTIQYALQFCSGGCEISLAAGTYSTATNGEIFPILVSASANNGIYFTGRQERANTIIDASGSGQDVIDVSAGIGFSLSGVTVRGGNYGIYLHGGTGYLSIGASITNSAISNNGTGILALYTSGEISHNEFSGNTSYGIYYDHSDAEINQNSFAFNCTGGIPSYDAAIYLAASSSPLVENNLIAWNNGSGIYVSNSQPLIINNTIWLNYGGSGIAVFSSFSQMIMVTNNIITSNGYIGIHTDSMDASQNKYNDVWGNGYSDYLGTSAGTGSISKDPRFVSLVDAHLLCSSPAINAGDPNDSPADDYDGNPRPVGIVDMGAYEKQSDLYCPIYLPIILK